MQVIKSIIISSSIIGLMAFSPADVIAASDRVECFGECEKQYNDLKRYARNGSPRAQTLLGLSYQSGEIHGIVDPDQAYRWMKHAARQRFAPAQYYLSQWYRKGYDDELDEEKAMDLLERSAKQNFPPALYQLGVLKLANDDYDAGLELVKQSADAGDEDARHLLARLNGEEPSSGQHSNPSGSSVISSGIGLVTSTVEQTSDDTITVVGNKEDPLFMFELMLDEIRDTNKYDRPGTTGTRLGSSKCGDSRSRCQAISGEQLDVQGIDF